MSTVAKNGKTINEVKIGMSIPMRNKLSRRNTNTFGKDFSLTIVEKKIALYNKVILRVWIYTGNDLIEIISKLGLTCVH